MRQPEKKSKGKKNKMKRNFNSYLGWICFGLIICMGAANYISTRGYFAVDHGSNMKTNAAIYVDELTHQPVIQLMDDQFDKMTEANFAISLDAEGIPYVQWWNGKKLQHATFDELRFNQ